MTGFRYTLVPTLSNPNQILIDKYLPTEICPCAHSIFHRPTNIGTDVGSVGLRGKFFVTSQLRASSIRVHFQKNPKLMSVLNFETVYATIYSRNSWLAMELLFLK